MKEKVDLVWKLVIFGGLSVLARLTWLTWESAVLRDDKQEMQIERLVELASKADARITLMERLYEIQSTQLERQSDKIDSLREPFVPKKDSK
jgi:hypothetical protein